MSMGFECKFEIWHLIWDCLRLIKCLIKIIYSDIYRRSSSHYDLSKAFLCELFVMLEN